MIFSKGTQRKDSDSQSSSFDRSLIESEERYYSLFNASLDAILLTAPDGSICAANPSACQMFARTEEEIIHLGRNGVVDTSDPRLAQALAIRDKTGKFAGDLTFVRKDGTKFQGEVSTSVFQDKNGNKRTSMIIRDLTERQLAEEAVRLSEETLRKAQKLGKTSCWRYKLDPKSTNWLKGNFLFFGGEGPPTYLSYADLSHAIHPDDQDRFFQAMELAITTGTHFELHLRIVTEHGTIGYIHTVCDVIEDAHGRATDLIGTTRDITADKLAQQDLQAAQARYQTVVEDQTELISRFRRDGTLIYANPAYCRFFGINYAEVFTIKWQQIAYQDDRESIEQHLCCLSLNHPVVTIENRVHTGDGSIRWIQFINRGIFNNDGELLEIQSVGRDISDLKDIQVSLQQKENELSRKNRDLEKLNIALEVAIEQKNAQLESLRSDIIKQYNSFVKPYIEELKSVSKNRHENQFFKLVEDGIQQILSPFAQQIMSIDQHLSPTETRVAFLIKSGLTINKVAEELNISPHTVKYHRKNIRSKLGIKNTKINLHSFLFRNNS